MAIPVRRAPALSAVVGAAFVVWGVALGLGALSDNSFLTHLATGRLILDRGSIPGTDPFSFTAGGEPWVVQSWLAAVLYGAAEELGGGFGLRLLMALTTAALAALVWRLTRPAGTLIGRVAVSGLVLGIGTLLWEERPYLIGLVLLATVLLAAEGGLDPRWLVPVMWIWANSHGSFPLGLVLLASLAAGRRLDRASADRAREAGPELRCLAWAAAGAVLAGVNPLGPRLLVFPLELLSRQAVLANIAEWQAPTFSGLGQRLFLLEVVAAVVLLVRRPRFRTAVPLVIFTAAALLGARNVGLAALVLIPGLARGVADLGTVTGEHRRPIHVVALGSFLAVAVVLVAGASRQADFRLDAYPVAAVRWLDDADLLEPDTRLVSRDFVGNYLGALRGTDAPVFIDDRYDMFPTAVIEDYLDLLAGRPDWSAILDRHRTEAVLWNREEPLGALLAASPDWRVAYQDDDWLVAVPTG